MTADDFTPAEHHQSPDYTRAPRNLIAGILAAGFAVAVVVGVWAARNFITSAGTPS